jgi:hypothetical protein
MNYCDDICDNESLVLRKRSAVFFCEMPLLNSLFSLLISHRSMWTRVLRIKDIRLERLEVGLNSLVEALVCTNAPQSFHIVISVYIPCRADCQQQQTVGIVPPTTTQSSGPNSFYISAPAILYKHLLSTIIERVVSTLQCINTLLLRGPVL